MFRKAITVLAVATIAFSTPAVAGSASYRIDAGSTDWIDLNLCTPTVSLEAFGDGDTDLDFSVYDPDGNVVHVDYDETDMTFAVIDSRLFESDNTCRVFRLEVINHGRVFNELRVNLTDA